MFAQARLSTLARPVMILTIVLAGFGLLAPATSASTSGLTKSPDLVITSAGSGYDRAGWHLQVTVKNQGGSAGAFYVKAGNSTHWVPGLASRSSVTLRFGTQDCPAGMWLVIADAYQQVAETNEWNNYAYVHLIC